MINLHRTVCWAVALLFLSACSQTPTQSTPAQPVPSTPSAMSKQTLQDLLTAEIAGQRGQYNRAATLYLKQAKATNDPDLAKRSSDIALYVGNPRMLRQSVELWAKNAPGNAKAQQAAADLATSQKRYQDALVYFARVFKLTGDGTLERWAYKAAYQQANGQTIDTLLEQYAAQHPKDTSIPFARSIALHRKNQLIPSLNAIERALKLEPENPEAKLHKSQLLMDLKRPQKALDWLDDAVDDHPKHKLLRLKKARLLLDQNETKTALSEFELLHQQHPHDAEILMSLAIIEDDQNDLETSKQHFERLINHPNLHQNAAFYLSRQALKQGDLNRALAYGIEVGSNVPDFFYLQSGLIETLIQQRSDKEALDYLVRLSKRHKITLSNNLLMARLVVGTYYALERWPTAERRANRALLKHKNASELLYVRALIYEKRHKHKKAESDLRRIIKQQPDHVEALNALGYALSNHSQRFDEALALVNKAHKLKPNSAAIMDTLGWVHFKLGHLDQAQALLEQAFDGMPDHEVAAHLGEVLWQQGQREQAKKVFKQGFERHPKSPLITEAINRLGVTLD